jgi:NADH-quinone oxidoreductase subunit A
MELIRISIQKYKYHANLRSTMSLSLTQSVLGLGIPVVLILIVGVGAYKLLSTILPSSPSPLKFHRFEAGNIPTGEGHLWFPLQYYGYLLVYTSIEPILVLLLIASTVEITSVYSPLYYKLLGIVGATIALLYPTVYYVVKQINRLERWQMRSI